MSIAKNPKRNTSDQRAAAFIASAGDPSPGEEGNRKLVPVRIPIAMLARIDRAASCLGLTRSGFIVLSAAERLTCMEGEFPSMRR
jgi:hypothetical protein